MCFFKDCFFLFSLLKNKIAEKHCYCWNLPFNQKNDKASFQQ